MKDKEPQKRILINEDPRPYVAFQQAIKAAIEKVKAGASTYNALGMGNFDQDVYKSIISGGVESIYEQYMKSAKDAVDKMGIPNPQIKQNLLNGTGELYNPFRKAVHELNSSSFKPGIDSTERTFPLELLTILDGQVVLDENAEENFKEAFCRQYISTPEEFAVYDSFQKVADAMNEFLPLLRKAEVHPNSYTLTEFNQLFHKNEQGNVSFRPDLVKWLVQKMKNPNPYNL